MVIVDKGSLIPNLWKKLARVSASGKNRKVDLLESLPDEIIIDILSRLPADFILKCRRVCKRWRALTITPYFAELQLMRATPTLIAGCYFHYYYSSVYFNVYDASKRQGWSGHGMPITTSGNLHWMVEHRNRLDRENWYKKLKTKFSDHPCAHSILRFNTQTESMDTMPHPGYNDCLGPNHGKMQLLVAEERLSICHIFGGGNLVDVWILVEYSNWHWIKSYKLNLNVLKTTRGDCLEEYADFIWIRKDELLLHVSFEGLFVYNLRQNTIREIAAETSHCFSFFYTHTKSLMSFRI
ncbi:hypothetical protein Tsubulata_002559 [Turnera subulata]|uniref:F-box domain-containing protein n=1 Tax=Turnera subulata TaxID=218843 RepID=A0A9Q0GA46_9ROSI|nr:hypothetical protein Tsubulata_002559 [Turnera subulata]